MIRKATAADIDQISAIYEQIHEREQSGLCQIGWLPGVYPVRDTALAALERDDAMITLGAFRWMLALTLKLSPDTPDWLLYPADMDFHHAPETCVFYTDEACSAVADAIRNSYVRDGAGEKMHMHIEPGMMHWEGQSEKGGHKPAVAEAAA